MFLNLRNKMINTLSFNFLFQLCQKQEICATTLEKNKKLYTDSPHLRFLELKQLISSKKQRRHFALESIIDLLNLQYVRIPTTYKLEEIMGREGEVY